MPLLSNINNQPSMTVKTLENVKRRENVTTLKRNREHTKDFLEAIDTEDSQCQMQEVVIIFDFCVESALNKFNETLLQAAQCMKRKIWLDTGHSRDTDRWSDGEGLRKKRQARRALNRFQRTALHADKTAHREKRSEYKSTISEKKKKQQQPQSPFIRHF